MDELEESFLRIQLLKPKPQDTWSEPEVLENVFSRDIHAVGRALYTASPTSFDNLYLHLAECEPDRLVNIVDCMVPVWTDYPVKEKEPTVANAMDALLTCDRCIRQSFEQQKPEVALREIASLWERLDSCGQLAEGKTRILLKQIEPPELTDAPPWFRDAAEELRHGDDELAASHPLAIESAQKMIRAALVVLRETGRAQATDISVERGPLGRVAVTIDVRGSGRLQWLVQAADLPWPGATVLALRRTGSGKAARRTVRTVHTAFELLDELRVLLATAE